MFECFALETIDLPELGRYRVVGRDANLLSRGDVSAVSGNRFQRLRAIEADPNDQRSLLTEPKPVRRLPVEIDGLY